MRHGIATAVAALAFGALASAQPVPPAGDPARGERVYRERCSGCHSLDANRIGPAHRGVFGRRAGQAPGFNYSPAVRRANLVWTAANLDRWLANPQALIPGQRMNFRLGDPALRADVIAYLRAQSSRNAPAAARRR
jgi:cytochrome c